MVFTYKCNFQTESECGKCRKQLSKKTTPEYTQVSWAFLINFYTNSHVISCNCLFNFYDQYNTDNL